MSRDDCQIFKTTFKGTVEKPNFSNNFLGIFRHFIFLEGVADIDIHKKLKNKITTKFKEKEGFQQPH
jgi:hypothetical protein